jgi:putative RNA 2'-phosphotransferase
MDLNQVSKYMSLILRHKPEVIGITLDEHGWANTNELVAGVKKKFPDFSKSWLYMIVETDEKKRYSFGNGLSKIRANQGHSIPVNLELEPETPPSWLYHGSALKYEKSIMEQGLIPKSRLYVHLSNDVETAINVGTRHGSPMIFRVNTKQMFEDGYEFFLSENRVWLTKEVPVRYLTRLYELEM